MLEDVERWLPGGLAGAEGLCTGQSTVGEFSPWAAQALIPLLPALVQATRRILDAPRTRAVERVEHIPPRLIRRPHRITVAALVRTPQASSHWRTVRSNGARETSNRTATSDVLLPNPTFEDTLDTPAHRYIAWLLQRVGSQAEELSARLNALANRTNDLTSGAEWCRKRAREARRGGHDLRRMLRTTFLGELKAEPASESVLMVVLNDPSYRAVHRIARRFLNASACLQPDAADVPTRPTFELYEMWCFLALHQALIPHLDQPSSLGRDVFTPGTTGEGIVAYGTTDGSPVELRFNASFRSFHHRGHAARWSVSTARRPDIVLRVGERWLAIDAKYRVGRVNLGRALESAHIYRDALRWSGAGGRATAAILVTPRVDEETQLWSDAEFISQHRVGVRTLAPGSDTPQAVMAWSLSALSSPPTHP